MRKLIFALVLLLALPIGVSASDIWGKKPTTNRIGYFDYSVPTGYIRIPGEDHSYCTKKFPKDRGYYIHFFVTDYTDVTEETLGLYYLLLANSTAPNRYNFEEITIEGQPACIYQLPSPTGDLTMVAYNRNGFTLAAVIGSEYAGLSTQKAFMLSLLEKIRYNDPLAEKTVSCKGTAKKFVNLRSEPNADSQKLGSLDSGAVVDVIVPYYTEKWHQIEYDGVTCYVSANYLELDK